MSYVDAFYDRNEDTIRVVERKNNKRHLSSFFFEVLYEKIHAHEVVDY